MGQFNYKVPLGIVIIFLFVSCKPSSDKKAKPATLTIATAANMQFAMKALSDRFTQQNGVRCNLVVSSSGKLTAQIKEGAPFDIFVAANMKYPDEVFKAGLATEAPRVYAYGKLVLWSLLDGVEPSLEALTEESIRYVALANPKTAPYGVAAIEVLQQRQIFDQVEPKLVYGESIAQTNQFITTKSAEVGFTAMSVVLSPKMKGKGKWVTLEESYSPIEQGVIVVNRKKVNPIALQFYEFLFSTEAKNILKEFGYTVEESE